MYKVIQWATGTLGSETLKRTIDHPDYELVGVYTYSPSKLGVDAGDLCGRARTGIKATNRIEDILALDADAVLHLPKLEIITTNSDREVTSLLASGKNVITSRGYQYPALYGQAYESQFTEACRRGSSTLFGTGIEPGFIYDTLAATLSGMCARIDEIRLWQWFDTSSRPYNTIYNVCLFGTDPARIDSRVPFAHTVGQLYREEFSLLAAHLDTTLTSFDLHVSAIPAPHDVVLRNGPPDVRGTTIHQGTTWAVILDFAAELASGARITFKMHWFVEPIPGWIDHDVFKIDIIGDPTLHLTFEFEDKWKAAHDPFHTAVGAHLTNLIPRVVAAPSGILHLRPLTARRLPVAQRARHD